jgi:hypothetical protein
MSPQEYLAAENCLKQRELPEFNFTFVGGCFPVQGSILFEKLFHQQVKNRMENEHAVNFNISIIRYERFTGCLEKLKAATRSQRMDAVVFCIRPEPVLRLTKISYRFADKNGRIKRKFNLPSSKYPFPEKHDLLSRLTTFIPSTQRKIPGSGLWSNLNYFAGILIGNNKVAMQRYLILVNEVADFCKKNSIPLFVMGPALRTNRFMEKVISQRLETFMKMQIPVDYVHYIRGSDQIKDGKKLFDPNGIHANEYYHKLIAGRIYSKLEGLVKEAVLLKRSIPDAETV